MSAATDKIKFFAKRQFESEAVLWESEVQGNILLSRCMIIVCFILAMIWAGNAELHLLDIDKEVLDMAFYRVTPVLAIPAIIGLYLKGEKKWLKYFLMFQYVFALAVLDALLTWSIELAMAFPVIISIRYYNKKFTDQTIFLTLILFLAFSQISPGTGVLDLNYVTDSVANHNVIILNGDKIEHVVRRLVDLDIYRVDYMKYHYLPKVLLYAMIAHISRKIAGKGRDMVVQQKDITTKSARIESELSLATDIQANLLPTIFPPFPERQEIDIYASMEPAKEVGGDFYDYFLIDEDHLGLVVGDVSGKGVPAALFMVTAKTLIKDHATMGLSAGQVYTRVNELLCEGNDAGLFVTSFMAIINLKTGRIYTVNAGHNPPMVCRGEKINDGIPGGNAEFEYLRTKPGFVLAGMDGIKYRATSFNMYPGDTIFLYTDGVTEATNADNELYGEDRLQKCLNSRKWDNTEEMINAVKVDVNEFVDVAPQFDDITMLAFSYRGPDGKGVSATNTITVSTTTEHVNYITEFVEGVMSKYNVPAADAIKINIAIDEIYSNIAKFAYIDKKTGEPRIGKATINAFPVIENDKTVGITLEFIDSGTPYNPLTQEDPLTNLPAEERDIGGLGIFIVKKQMDDVSYRYEDHRNILSITKMISKEEKED